MSERSFVISKEEPGERILVSTAVGLSDESADPEGETGYPVFMCLPISALP
jgi:hypothetical protein